MTQQKLDRLLLLALFLTVAGDLLAFFLEIENQRQDSEEETAQQAIKKEICELRNELRVLKIEVDKLRPGN